LLIEALGLDKARVIALCGAGGKTSLMRALALEMASRGERVLVTTTTKLAIAEGQGYWPPGVCLSHRGESAGKLLGQPPATIDCLKRQGEFDRLLVEADGSRRRPLKAPAAHEPVIPSTSDAVVVIAGMSALGLPLSDETVFRAEIWAALSATPLGAPVDAESFARVALHEAGLAKGCREFPFTALFLNQSDTARAGTAAAAIVRLIAASSANPFTRIVSGRLQPAPATWECWRRA
jgi:probable selenium-dependent hydroxylase accessory protein YqeC